MEIGSADGVNAKYLQDCGYCVTASDIADDFLKAIKEKNLKTIKLNIVQDSIKEKYDGIFCWRVFVHFSKEDFVASMDKIYNALSPNGIMVFNVINRETKSVDHEMVDFQNEYKMGKERYYQYYTQDFIDNVIKKYNFEIVDFHKEGGDQKNKWLVYTIKKTI